jgi:hypothetical protein
MIKQSNAPYKGGSKKNTRQGAGTFTKIGRHKGSICKYRGQGGRRKSVKH